VTPVAAWLVSGAADGPAGLVTVGVYVASDVVPSRSVIRNWTGAVPLKPTAGRKVTTPVAGVTA
jgi:hypothetical protein